MNFLLKWAKMQLQMLILELIKLKMLFYLFTLISNFVKLYLCEYVFQLKEYDINCNTMLTS